MQRVEDTKRKIVEIVNKKEPVRYCRPRMYAHFEVRRHGVLLGWKDGGKKLFVAFRLIKLILEKLNLSIG